MMDLPDAIRTFLGCSSWALFRRFLNQFASQALTALGLSQSGEINNHAAINRRSEIADRRRPTLFCSRRSLNDAIRGYLIMCAAFRRAKRLQQTRSGYD